MDSTTCKSHFEPTSVGFWEETDHNGSLYTNTHNTNQRNLTIVKDKKLSIHKGRKLYLGN